MQLNIVNFLNFCVFNANGNLSMCLLTARLITEMSMQSFDRYLKNLDCDTLISCSRYLEGILSSVIPRLT